MAVGANFRYITGRQISEIILLENQNAATDGTWLPLGGEHPFTVTVKGTFSGTVKIRVSNDASKPLDSDNTQAQLGSDVTEPKAIQVDFPYQWIKAQVSSYVSGSITAQAFSAQPIASSK